jgi:UDP-galactopyranose mutase
MREPERRFSAASRRVKVLARSRTSAALWGAQLKGDGTGAGVGQDVDASSVIDQFDTLVVGAGFAGAVMAERLASQCGQRVLVIDQRDHIAGTAYDYVDEHGVLIHAYGPHIFHTQSARVVDYLSQFTEWRQYEHRVFANLDDRLVPMPINRTTVNAFFGLDLDTDEAVEALYAEKAEPVAHPRNSEEAVVSRIGRELYEAFFRGYTRKQWRCDPSDLHASVCGRVAIRANADDRYFSDRHQQMPADGYTALFERMLDHPAIEVRTGVTFDAVRGRIRYGHLVYTGLIDAFFDYEYGPLPYRSLAFDLRNEPTPGGSLVQPTATINFPSEEVPWTRITEYRHLTGQVHDSSTVAVEYPVTEGDPYYPVPSDYSRALYKRYEAHAARLADVTFVGRLARYQYLNMDQVVGQALSTIGRLVRNGRMPVRAVAGR